MSKNENHIKKQKNKKKRLSLYGVNPDSAISALMEVAPDCLGEKKETLKPEAKHVRTSAENN